jgi:hypothetical protein
MPISPHRQARAAVLVAFAAALLLSIMPASAAVPSSPIAVAAIGYEGTWQGECWVFVKKVVKEATGREMGFDYRQGFFDAGAIEVRWDQAQSGDIVQIANDADTSANAGYNGLHTAIITENLGDGSFNVVDSNQNFDGIVHRRTGYNPAENAARSGLSYHIYRITGSPSFAPVPRALPVPGQKFQVGDRVVTATPNDILRLRSAAGTNSTVLGRIADRTRLTVTGETVATDGYHWVKVSTPMGIGWVAAEYLARDTSPDSASAGAPAAAGPSTPGGSATKPLLQFRSVVPVISAGD